MAHKSAALMARYSRPPLDGLGADSNTWMVSHYSSTAINLQGDAPPCLISKGSMIIFTLPDVI